jgi:S-adenosylmethionine synthetase
MRNKPIRNQEEDKYHVNVSDYGHFGRKEFTWEQVDAVEELPAKAKNA